MSEWPEPVERVAAVLRDAGVEGRVEAFVTPTPTAQDAARAAGCELGQIVKTLVFHCDGQPAAVLVPGDRRADAALVAQVLGCAKARVARAEEVELATGFAPGAVAPFPLPGVGRVLIERLLLAHDVVWVGAGSPTHLAVLAPGDLIKLARAEVADVVEPGT